MMIGLGTIHAYTECPECACLQISEYPNDLANYYNSGYYSHSPRELSEAPGLWEAALRGLRRRIALTANRQIVSITHAGRNTPLFYRAVSGLSLSRTSKIIDVGCGSGWLLEFLLREGFENVSGYDPFATVNEVRCGKKIAPVTRSIAELEGGFDLVYCCRSFEHMTEPRRAMAALVKLLSRDGVVVLVLPVVGHGWRFYRENWVQLNAPMHLYIHSRVSIEKLLNDTDYRIDKWVSCSTEFLFWGSEQYKMGIPLSIHDLNRPRLDMPRLFTRTQIESWRRDARVLNKRNEGDEAIVVIKRKQN